MLQWKMPATRFRMHLAAHRWRTLEVTDDAVEMIFEEDEHAYVAVVLNSFY